MKYFHPFTFVGIIFIVAGILLVILPFITQYIPRLEKLPLIIIWVYKSENFMFVASPILLIITVISFILNYLKH
ncbi:MAG TPA: hypothetical protein ENN36_02215 [Candidatus Bathyarchaeota archaeon]|nr:hypothetical protein [Candidatus Bathyarchaeota archaeon]